MFNKYCVIYSRISTENQKFGHSLNTQFTVCKEYADSNNLIIKNSYSDINSGTKMKKLEELNRLINENENVYLLVTNLDRFSRNLGEACNYIDKLDRKKIILYSVEQLVSTKNINGIREVKCILADAELESKRLGSRLKLTFDCIKKKGGHIGPARYGFKKKKLKNIPITIPDKYETEIISLIKNLRLGEKKSSELSKQITKITNINVPLKFYDKNDNEIIKFSKPFTLTYSEIANILDDYNIKIRNKKPNKINISNIFLSNSRKRKPNYTNNLINNMNNLSL